VLTSGNHAAIARWRHEQSVQRTRQRRPDLLDAHEPEAHEEERIRPDDGAVAD